MDRLKENNATDPNAPKHRFAQDGSTVDTRFSIEEPMFELDFMQFRSFGNFVISRHLSSLSRINDNLAIQVVI